MNLEDVLNGHPQIHQSSCIAWSLELLLKRFDKIGLKEFPFQKSLNPCGYGFGERERIELKAYGLKAEQYHQNPINFGDFLKHAENEIKCGKCIVFTMPSYLYLDLEVEGISVACHAFTAFRRGHEWVFSTWDFNKNRLIESSERKMERYCQEWARIASVRSELIPHFLNSLAGTD